MRLRGFVIVVVVFCAYMFPATGISTQEQDGTDTQIVFAEELKKRAREQLRRLLAEYDLDPWIFTQEVQIAVGVDPHSKPVLTLNTDHLDNDERQLSIFLHEQAHWFVADRPDARDAAIAELSCLYPDPPTSELRLYQHLLVAWVELDAMVELIGEERARRVLEEKVQSFMQGPLSVADRRYRWYNNQVIEDTDEIGAIVARHDLIITPEKGLVVETT